MRAMILGSTALLTSLFLPSLLAAEDYVIDVPVVTTNGGNTLDGDDSITVSDTGSVTTDGSEAHGLYASGNNNTLTNSGTVMTVGEFAYGLYASGNNNTLTNSDTVTTSGFGARGLYAGGNNNTLTNSGTVTTGGDYAYGLAAYTKGNADNNTLTNSGTVTTGGFGAHGLYADGDDNTLTNSETVTSSGDEAHGLYASGNNNTLTNSGTVTTGGEFAYGLYASGNNNTLTNSDTVTTSGLGAHGLFASGNDNTLNNSGTVTTSVAAYGLLAYGDSNTLTNSGTVTTGGDAAQGLRASGDNNTLNNSGTVTTSGVEAHGLFASGDSNTLTNSGTVTTSGDAAFSYTNGAVGLYAIGNNNTLTNSGTVISEQSYSIYTTGAGATLNLLEGSVLQGDVFLNADATLNFGPGLNAAVNTAGTIPTTITTQGGASVVSGTVIYAVDSTGFVAGDQTVGVVGGMALDALARQQADSPRVQVSQGTVAPQGWAQVFGGYRSRDGDDSTVEFTGYSFGAMAGKELSGGHGFFIGGAHSRDESDSSFENRSNTVFGGYYTAYDIGTVAVDASLTFGVAQNDNERTVANNMVEGGIETAKAEYNSYFLMPSATFKGDWAVASGTLTPSLRLRYAGVYHDAYTETGSAANMDVDSRVSHLAEARLQLERGLPDLATPGGTLMTDVRFGVDAQYFTGDDISSTLAGQSLVFTPEDDDVAGRAFVGLDMRHIADDGGWDLRGGVELGHSNIGTTDVSATVRWSMNF